MKQIEKTLIFGSMTVKSSAQAMTLIAYGDSNNGEKANIPFRNLDFNCECDNFEDFNECIKLIDSYNEFNYEEMKPSLNKYLNLKKYYNENNPNNGSSFFKFHIAREGSPAFYVSIYPEYDRSVILDNINTSYTVDDFKSNMEILKNSIKADSLNIKNDGFSLTAHFWFD